MDSQTLLLKYIQTLPKSERLLQRCKKIWRGIKTDLEKNIYIVTHPDLRHQENVHRYPFTLRENNLASFS